MPQISQDALVGANAMLDLLSAVRATHAMGQSTLEAPRTTAGWSAAGALSAPIAALVVGLVTFGFLLTVYGLTMAPDLSWANDSQDGGELITAAVTLGIPHPPGYPTYVAIGKLFSLLPVGTVAFRFNLLSAVATAAAGGLLAALLALRGRGSLQAIVVAIGGGAAFGLLPIVWSQATVTEVYGLNVLLVAAFLLCLLGLRSPVATGVFLGLAITAHLSSALLIPMAFLLTTSRQWGKIIGGAILGLLPLMLLPLLARSGSPVVWGAPHTFEGWWWLVTGQLYHPNIALPAPSATAWPVFSPQDSWPMLVVAGLGMAVALLALRTSGKAQLRPLGLAAGLTAVLYGLFALLYQTADAYVLLIPALLLLTFVFFDRVPLPGALALLLPILLLGMGYSQQNLRGDRLVRPLAEAVMKAAPANAILLTPGDRTIFTLWYFHHVEKQRPDLVLVDANLLAFDWYRERLMLHYPALGGLASDDLLGFSAANLATGICEVGLWQSPAEATPPGYTYRVGAEDQVPFLMCQDFEQ